MAVIALRVVCLLCIYLGYEVSDADAYRVKHGQMITANASKMDTADASEDRHASLTVTRGKASASPPLIIAERMRISIAESRLRAYVHANTPSSLLHTIGMGVVYGFLQAIAPDHLGTLITLGTGVDDVGAFKVAASWALGHCFGIVLLALIVLLCKEVSKKVSTFKEDWEYYGDYAAGIAMIFVGVYFMLRRSAYLDEQSDGTYVLKGCVCHGAPSTLNRSVDAFCVPCEPQASGEVLRSPTKKAKPGWENAMSKQGSHDQGVTTQFPVSSDVDLSDPGWEERGWAGAIAGFIQGACCPSGLVGITFLAQVQPSGLIIFFLCFCATTILGTSCLAVGWAKLLRSNANWLPARLVYVGSCCLTISLGIVWIICNYFGVLKNLEYTDHIEVS